jgi:hypothetical protein
VGGGSRVAEIRELVVSDDGRSGATGGFSPANAVAANAAEQNRTKQNRTKQPWLERLRIAREQMAIFVFPANLY